MRPDRSVGDIRIVKSLDKVFGLDDMAIEAARQWLFRPGTRNGQPVPVIVRISLTFRTGDPFVRDAYRPGAGVTSPVLKGKVEAKHTPAALRQKIHGDVRLEAVADPDGTVNRVRVSQSLDSVYGLDDQAIAAPSSGRLSRVH